MRWIRIMIVVEAVCVTALILVWTGRKSEKEEKYLYTTGVVNEEQQITWVELLAYLGAKYGGDFKGNSKCLEKDMNWLVKKLTEEGLTMEELTKGMKYYEYYREAYGAVLDGMVGEYDVETVSETGEKSQEKKYGLKAYFPIAKGFEYTHYDDFGSGRSYGYKRKHLGHDMMGQTGTLVVAEKRNK